MSHFSVLVIGPDIEAQLQPYHEFECTDTNDQYVVDVDLTAELRTKYETETRSMCRMPDGSLVSRYDDSLYREPTDAEIQKIGGRFPGSGRCGGLSFSSQEWSDGLGYRPKIHDPQSFGAVDLEVPFRDCMGFLEFVTYERGEQEIVDEGTEPRRDMGAKYGYTILNEHGEVVAVFDRTNPNAKWDGWRIGGRWRGFLPVKPDSTSGTLGDEAWEVAFFKYPDLPERVADQCTVGDLDVDRARREAAAEAAVTFDKWARLFAECGKAKTWTEVRDGTDNIDQARQDYRSQPLIIAAEQPEEKGGLGHSFGCWVEKLGYDRAAYIRKCEDRALVPYAVVKDGKWHAKGDMGWWGMSDDKVSQGEWNAEFHRMLADLPPDTLLTIVDCHI